MSDQPQEVVSAEDTSSHTKEIFGHAMSENWDSLLTSYKKYSNAQNKRITRTGDTALHVAAWSGKTDVVQQLVQASSDGVCLYLRNRKGNTPLHVAAALGYTDMCHCMMEKDKTCEKDWTKIDELNKKREEPKDRILITERNDNGETPIFLAVFHGKDEAFDTLKKWLPRQDDKQDLSYFKRNDGATILHCVISGGYYELAMVILKDYGDLVNSRDEHGNTVLHLLARSPSSFRSGSRFDPIKRIIYYCAPVDDSIKGVHDRKNGQNSKQHDFIPENYETCWNFFSYLWAGFYTVMAMKNPFKEEDAVTGKDRNRGDVENSQGGGENQQQFDPTSSTQQISPPNYTTCFNFLKFLLKIFMVVAGLGIDEVEKIQAEKRKHHLASLILDKILLKDISNWEYDGAKPEKQEGPHPKETLSDGETKNENKPNENKIGTASIEEILSKATAMVTKFLERFPALALDDGGKGKQQSDKVSGETPVLIAARMGVVEMVEKILERFPIAIHDENKDGKNIVLLAVENRQPDVFMSIQSKKTWKESIFGKVDKEGNNALHLAAKHGQHRPWLMPGAAMEMQWEIKWYKFVKDSMPPHFFASRNNEEQTPKEVFTETHKELVKQGGDWLNFTAQSYSVVAGLIATVAFASSATVPGGVNQETGIPILEHSRVFGLFAISSLAALVLSITALVMFLAILTSRHQESDFQKNLPKKLIIGLTTLFFSIGAMLVAFSAGHFFAIKNKLESIALPIYTLSCLPVTFYALAQFPLYLDLIKSTYTSKPESSYKVVL